MANLINFNAGKAIKEPDKLSPESAYLGVADGRKTPSSSRPVTPNSLKTKKSFGTSFRGLFSRRKSPAPPSPKVNQEQVLPQDVQNTTEPETLLSSRKEYDLKQENFDPARKIALYEMGSQAVDLFQQVAKITELVLPSPVGEILEKLTGILGILKQMVENDVAWKELISTLDSHQKLFNDQLVRLKKGDFAPDPNSALLEPIKRYSRALEEMTANILVDSGLMEMDIPNASRWEGIKKFTKRFWTAGKEQQKTQEYRARLSDAIQDLLMGLALYTGVTVQEIMTGVLGLAKQLEKMDAKLTARPAAVRTIKALAKAVPSVSPYYVRRNAESEIMQRNLVEIASPGQKIFAITGMGGCGKTQIVSYFLQENPSLYTHVIVVDASSSANIKNDLETWARSLVGGHDEDSWEHGLNILSRGSLNGRWLLILDNADDPTVNLVPFLPKCSNGTVIITSRNRDIGDLATSYHLELGQMTKDEALAVLLQAARRQSPLPIDELTSAHTLMEELGCLAVALVQAGTYCHQLSSNIHEILHPYSFTKYLRIFYSQRSKLMKKPGPTSLDNYHRGAYTTFDLSYQAMPENAREFLHFISYFHRSDISMVMFEVASAESFKDWPILLPRPEQHEEVVSRLYKTLCTDEMWDELMVEETIQVLRSFSLVSTTIINDSMLLQIHPLVQAWSRDMVSSRSQGYQAMARQVLTSCCRDSHLPLFRSLFPHLRSMIETTSPCTWHVNDQVAAGRILKQQGRDQEAQGIFTEARELVKNVVKQENQETLLLLGEIASSYKNQGMLDKAEEAALEVLEQRRSILGLGHPDSIVAAGNLAVVYGLQGRMDDEERLELGVLEHWTRHLGMENLRTIQAAANLARTYAAKGKWAEAEKLELGVLERRLRILGTEHPDTIQAMDNIAATYSKQGRWKEAEKMSLEVLEKRTSVNGGDHPHTAMAIANLAVLYSDQEMWGEAEKMASEALELRRRILPPDHPDLTSSVATLAVVIGAQGRRDEAVKMEIEVLEQLTRTRGRDHPDTIRATANLAVTYGWLGKLEEEKEMELEVLEQRTRILGKEHPDTITVAGNLAMTYHWLERFADAEKVGLEVLEQRRRLLGLAHPSSILAAENLTLTYHSEKKWKEAELLSLEVLEVRKKMDPKMEHADTIRATVTLALAIRYQDRWAETEILLAPAVERSLQVMGAQNPSTQRYIQGLVKVYKQLGKEKEAEETEKLLLA